jgi:ClpP class serine protease
MTGATAVEKGLVDSIGSRRQAREVLAELIGDGTVADDIVYCEYNPYLTLI